MDIEHIKQLVELMVESDLSRVEIEEGETRILLRRGQPPLVSAAPPVAHGPAVPSPAADPGQAAAAPAPAAEPFPAGAEEGLIKSPMVGTFYAAHDPESPPFVQVGDTVGPDTVVCLVEAMKVFNEIRAEKSGRITKVLVKNAEAVEFDQPLFAIAPAPA